MIARPEPASEFSKRELDNGGNFDSVYRFAVMYVAATGVASFVLFNRNMSSNQSGEGGNRRIMQISGNDVHQCSMVKAFSA